MMRSFVIRLVLWLCARFNITLLDEQRIGMGEDVLLRSQRWETFYREAGGLADMIAELRREAFEAAQEIDPRDTDKIYYWAMCDRNLRKLDQRVRGVISAGEVERKRREAMQSNPIKRKSVY
jgi:hypothetical protein